MANLNGHLVFSILAVGLLTFGLAQYFSQSLIIAILFALLSSPVVLGFYFCFLYLKEKLTTTQQSLKRILLLSHDDELLGQLRYLFPYEHIAIDYVRTFENAVKHLKEKTPDALIIDTSQKLKNTTNLVTLFRSLHDLPYRLPIAAVQKNMALENKRQLLLEGFDDYLSKPIKAADAEIFLSRWLSDESNKHALATVNESKEKPENLDLKETNRYLEYNFDKEQALLQSHQNILLAKDMLNMLIEMIEKNKTNLQQLYHNQDWENLHEVTHKIKGGCYCTGLPTFEKTMESIDKALETQQLQHIETLFKTMMLEIDNLLMWYRQQNIDELFAD